MTRLATQLPKTSHSIGTQPSHSLAGAHLQRCGGRTCPAGTCSHHEQGTLRGAGQPLDLATRAFMEPRFGHDFSQVRIHTDTCASASGGVTQRCRDHVGAPDGRRKCLQRQVADPATATRAVSALAYTVGSDIVFAPGRFAPDTDSGMRLLAHELTHVLQQRRRGVRAQCQDPAATSVVDPDELEADAAARQLGRPSRRPPGMNIGHAEARQITECLRIMGRQNRAYCYDTILGWRPPDVSLANQPEADRLQLKIHNFLLGSAWSTAIESYFATPPKAAPAVPTGQQVVVGTSVESKFEAGAKAAAAFFLDQVSRAPDPTRSVLPPNRTFNVAIQATGQVFRFSRLGTVTLLIEQIGPITPGPATVPDAAVTDTSFTIGTRTFKLGTGWRSNDLARVKTGLAAMPPGTLPPTGTQFKREAVKVCTPAQIAAKTCDPSWAGLHNYEHAANRHTITLYDGAFTEGARRHGTFPWLNAILAHEVGHALDYEPLRTAMKAFNVFSSGTPAQRKSRLLGARSRSGRRYTEGATSGGTIHFNVDENAASRAGAYRKAALADGLQANPAGVLSQGTTDYSEKSWAENFAENFSIYVTDPDLLRLLRPNIHSYFEKQFPR